MPSFDIVSGYNMQELDNAVNMVTRDITNRYDFRGSKTKLTLDKSQKVITIEADNSMQLAAVVDMLKSRAINRKVSLKVFKFQDEELRSWKHKFLKRLDHYHELIYDEKERAKVDPKLLLKEFEDDGS